MYICRVHFLSHYSLSPFPDDPLFNLGIVVPDIHRGFCRVYNTSSFKQFCFDQGQWLSLHRGILEHYRQDHCFHHSPLFTTWVQQFSDLARPIFVPGHNFRLSFLAHIGVEYLLDRQLILQHLSCVDSFYKSLTDIEWRPVQTYFDCLGFSSSGFLIRARVEWFLDNRFLYYFGALEKMTEGVFRIYSQSTGYSPDDVLKKKLFTVFAKMDNVIRAHHVQLFYSLQKQLYAA